MSAVAAEAAEVSWPHVFTAALRGDSCTIHGLHGTPMELPVRLWDATADGSDREVLEHCSDLTLDIGCGPGRMSEELGRRGLRVLGIDLVPEAVDRARRRGVSVLERDVFDPVPGEGRWRCALLADGNIGIGGDPARLLSRVHSLLAPKGRVVVDLAPPGTGLRERTVALECSGRRSEPFRWAMVGPESMPGIARRARLALVGQHRTGDRHFAVLQRA